MSETPETLELTVVERSIRIHCEHVGARELLAHTYGGMIAPGSGTGADLEYRVAPVAGPDGGFRVHRSDREIGRAGSATDAVCLLKQDLVVEIQRARPDLYFVHAAALEHEGRALILVAESGGGKSMTTWALLHHGLRQCTRVPQLPELTEYPLQFFDVAGIQ